MFRRASKYSQFPTDMSRDLKVCRASAAIQPSSDLVTQRRCAAKFELVIYPLETDYKVEFQYYCYCTRCWIN